MKSSSCQHPQPESTRMLSCILCRLFVPSMTWVVVSFTCSYSSISVSKCKLIHEWNNTILQTKSRLGWWSTAHHHAISAQCALPNNKPGQDFSHEFFKNMLSSHVSFISIPCARARARSTPDKKIPDARRTRKKVFAQQIIYLIFSSCKQRAILGVASAKKKIQTTRPPCIFHFKKSKACFQEINLQHAISNKQQEADSIVEISTCSQARRTAVSYALPPVPVGNELFLQ